MLVITAQTHQRDCDAEFREIDRNIARAPCSIFLP